MVWWLIAGSHVLVRAPPHDALRLVAENARGIKLLQSAMLT